MRSQTLCTRACLLALFPASISATDSVLSFVEEVIVEDVLYAGQPPIEYPNELAVVPGGIMGDGNVSIVFGALSAIYWFENNGTGLWPKHEVYYNTSTIKRPFQPHIAVADIEGDGILDVVSGWRGLSWYRGNGDGTFNFAVIEPYSNHRWPLTGDVDRDGVMDIFVERGTSGLWHWYRGGPEGLTFHDYIQGTDDYSTSITRTTELADIDGDGYLDIVGGGFYNFPQRTTLAWCRYNNETGTFEAPFFIGGNRNAKVVTGKIDSDDTVDVLTITGAGSISYFRNIRGDGSEWVEVNVSTVDRGQSFRHIALADFNNDGVPEIVATDHANANRLSLKPLAIFQLNGSDGSYIFSETETKYRVRDLKTADMNSDGLVDIVVVDHIGWYTSKIAWLRNGAHDAHISI